MHLTGSLFTAGPFTRQQIDQIRIQFESMLRCKLTFQVVDDPSLLGGFVAKIDGKVYDASLTTQLGDLKQALLQAQNNDQPACRQNAFAEGDQHDTAR